MADHRPPTRTELMTQAQGRAVTSQATTIEQSRAVAQVQGALIVAQQRPRNTLAAAERVREACQNQRLAERAFFSYRRAGSNVTGPSVHLARELARCWGNIDYGITELARNDEQGESEMLAYAWDLETNARSTNSFIVPHKRDTSSGARVLTDQRDIYENNANNAARRLRECIFAVLPRSLLDEAEDICRETLESGGGEPIEQRRAKLAEAFAAIGVTPTQIARRAGRPVDRLTAFDIGQLKIDYRSIKTGEIARDEVFPPEAGADAAKELLGQAKPAAAPPAKAEEPKPAPAPAKAAAKAEPPKPAAPPPPVELVEVYDAFLERRDLPPVEVEAFLLEQVAQLTEIDTAIEWWDANRGHASQRVSSAYHALPFVATVPTEPAVENEPQAAPVETAEVVEPKAEPQANAELAELHTVVWPGDAAPQKMAIEKLRDALYRRRKTMPDVFFKDFKRLNPQLVPLLPAAIWPEQ